MVIIVGIVLVAAAAGMLFGRKKQENKLFQMKATETLTASALEQEARDVADGLGETGSFNKITEVKGKVVCEDPLVSELAQKQCVEYTMSIMRKWEEKYWDTDSEGRRVQKTRQGSDIVASNTSAVPFQVQDATGKVSINPEGAEMIREKVYSKFVPGEPRSPSVQIGRFNFNLGNLTALAGGRRTIGYSYEESVIPLTRDIYVLGEAADSSGELRIQKPSEKGKKFIISVKSEEELSRGIEKSLTILLVLAIICGIGGVVLVILNLLGVFS